MLVFIALTALYYGAVLLLLFRHVGNTRLELKRDRFICPAHTDTLKGLAAIGILISHIAAQIKFGMSGPVRYYTVFGTTLGGIGVNLFFFASGFGNYFSANKLKTFRERIIWLLKRLLSLIVIYLVCFAIASLVLYFCGYRQSLKEILDRIVGLRMPLTKTWYLKVQILLYIFLTLSLFIKSRLWQGVCLVGLSLASSLLFWRLGYTEEWWKSTLCFALGYYGAMYKDRILLFVNCHRKQLLFGSLATLPLFFVMACLIDFYPVKVLGNTLLAAVMILLAEFLDLENKWAIWIGMASLEIYLIHIPFSSWFLREKTVDTLGIVAVVGCTAVAAFMAKWIDDRLLPRIRKLR